MKVRVTAYDPRSGRQVDIGDYEWVQVTYDIIRTSPDGDNEIAVQKGGEWFFDGHSDPFSDFTVEAI